MTLGPDAAHVPITPARAHLQQLADDGVTLTAIAAQLGVAQTAVSNWLRTEPTERHKVMTRLHALTARRVLALRLDDFSRVPEVSAAATRRRVDALLAAGHGMAPIVAKLGGWRIDMPTIPLATADAVAAVYERLADAPPRPRPGAQRAAADAALDARRRGAHPPRAWRDIEAGELREDADPKVRYASIDAVLAGRWRHLTDPEYLAAIERMLAQGRRWAEVSRTLRLAPRTAKRTYQRLRDGEALHLADRELAARGSTKGTLAPIEPVVRHLERLETAGATLTDIAETASVPLPSIRNYLGRGSRPSPAWITASSAQRILALHPSALGNLDPRVDPASTVRRIQALATRGWSIATIASALDVPRSRIEQPRRRSTIPQSLRDAVAELYSRVAFGPPPTYTSIRARGQAVAYQREAIAAGWPSPIDWADIETGVLDDEAPQATADAAEPSGVRGGLGEDAWHPADEAAA